MTLQKMLPIAVSQPSTAPFQNGIILLCYSLTPGHSSHNVLSRRELRCSFNLKSLVPDFRAACVMRPGHKPRSFLQRDVRMRKPPAANCQSNSGNSRVKYHADKPKEALSFDQLRSRLTIEPESMFENISRHREPVCLGNNLLEITRLVTKARVGKHFVH
jgi:hypothetical protein